MSKTVGGAQTLYGYNELGQLAIQTTPGKTLIFYYSADGSPEMITYNGANYILRVDAQGNVVNISNQAGTRIVEYSYDAWGNPVRVYDPATGNTITDPAHIANVNPFRYRSYYFDTESGFYFLQSRYYDPATGRFINADGILGANGDLSAYNLFAYCGNNPVMNSDPTGSFVLTATAVLIIVDIFFIAAIGTTAAVGIYQAYTAPMPNTRPAPDLTEIIPFPAPTPPQKSNKKEPVIPPVPNPAHNQTPPKKPKGLVYYHSTTKTNAAIIKAPGALVGSSYEGGYVFAWKLKPDSKAINISGAHKGAVISFRTNAAFEDDRGIDNYYARRFGPVRSVFPGRVNVWDIQIVDW